LTEGAPPAPQELHLACDAAALPHASAGIGRRRRRTFIAAGPPAEPRFAALVAAAALAARVQPARAESPTRAAPASGRPASDGGVGFWRSGGGGRAAAGVLRGPRRLASAAASGTGKRRLRRTAAAAAPAHLVWLREEMRRLLLSRLWAPPAADDADAGAAGPGAAEPARGGWRRLRSEASDQGMPVRAYGNR
jgi:hypothetical protein